MKRFLFAFLLGAAAGATGYWYFSNSPQDAPLRQAASNVATEAGRVRQRLEETLDLRPETIRDELARSSMIVREKARQAGESIADAAQNARVTAVIKGRLIAEPGLASTSINVDTTDGLVTLSGLVSSPADVSRAVRIALETDGVRKVISTLQVRSVKEPVQP